MRATLPAALIGLLALFTAPSQHPAEFPHRDIAGDLKLLAELKSGPALAAGTQPWIMLTLVNTSATVIRPVVKPGDGTAWGWREPYVYYTAERLAADGRWVSVERSPDGPTCGVFDADWSKDVVDLNPGGRLLVDLWGAAPLDYQQPGRVRVVAHYAYRATPSRRSQWQREGILGRMSGAPAFDVRSEPVEFEIVRPLDVRVRVKRPMTAGVAHRLSDILDVTVTNLTPAARPLAASTVQLQFGGIPPIWLPNYIQPPSGIGLSYGMCRNLPAHLPAGGGASLFGPDRLDGTWTLPRPEAIRVRAAVCLGSGDSASEVRSEWADVRVEK